MVVLSQALPDFQRCTTKAGGPGDEVIFTWSWSTQYLVVIATRGQEIVIWRPPETTDLVSVTQVLANWIHGVMTVPLQDTEVPASGAQRVPVPRQ